MVVRGNMEARKVEAKPGWKPACFGVFNQDKPACADCPIVVQCDRCHAKINVEELSAMDEKREAQAFPYLFPEIVNPSKKNLCRTPYEQAQKIIEEATETFEEAKRGDGGAMLIECLDVMHACETMLRRNFTDDQINEGVRQVVEKNKKRGFYDLS